MADSFASFLLALREIAREGNVGRGDLAAAPRDQPDLAGRRPARRPARLRAAPGVPARRRPRVRPRRDAAAAGRDARQPRHLQLRLRPLRARAWSRASSPTTSPASPATSRTGCATTAQGDVAEALWWWQFSYVSSWGNLAGVVAQRAALGGRPRPARRRVHRRGRGRRRGRRDARGDTPRAVARPLRSRLSRRRLVSTWRNESALRSHPPRLSGGNRRPEVRWLVRR